VTPDEARIRLRAALSDDVMQAERLRVLMAVQRRASDLMAALGLDFALALPEVAERFAVYQEMHHVPGDHLWQAMQFVFRVARDGGDEADQALVGHYTQRILQTLFTAPLKSAPVIPDSWWQTPLGVAYRAVTQGIEACYDVLAEIDA